MLVDAIEYKKNILNSTNIEKKNYTSCNKEDGLPANISYIRSRIEDKKIIGYQLCLTHNGKKYENRSKKRMQIFKNYWKKLRNIKKKF